MGYDVCDGEKDYIIGSYRKEDVGNKDLDSLFF